MELLFRMAESSANGILYIMGLMSVMSVAIMIERFLALKRVSASSSGKAEEFKTVMLSQDFEQIEKFSESNSSLEGRALGYGLNFVKKHGINGLDELFNSFKTLQKPGLEKNLNILG